MEQITVVEELSSGKPVEIYCLIEDKKVSENKRAVRCVGMSWREEAYNQEETLRYKRW